jgi:tRNA nucleotidyltransferase (CCA-adding enzyme)
LKQSKNSATPEEQDDILATTLKRIYNSINKERDREQWKQLNEGVWKDVTKWVGETRMENIYNQIFK